MTEETNLRANSPDRYQRILHAVGSSFEQLGAWPDHPRALETVADAVEQLLERELAAVGRLHVFIAQGRDQGAKGITWDALEQLLDQPVTGEITVISDTVIVHAHEEAPDA